MISCTNLVEYALDELAPPLQAVNRSTIHALRPIMFLWSGVAGAVKAVVRNGISEQAKRVECTNQLLNIAARRMRKTRARD